MKTPDKDITERLLKLDYVENVYLQDNKASITIKSVEKDSQKLLREIAESDVYIASINLRRTALKKYF
jgi:hypothetical protein